VSTRRVDLVQSGHHHYICKIQLVVVMIELKIVHLVFNNHSLVCIDVHV